MPQAQQQQDLNPVEVVYEGKRRLEHSNLKVSKPMKVGCEAALQFCNRDHAAGCDWPVHPD